VFSSTSTHSSLKFPVYLDKSVFWGKIDFGRAAVRVGGWRHRLKIARSMMRPFRLKLAVACMSWRRSKGGPQLACGLSVSQLELLRSLRHCYKSIKWRRTPRKLNNLSGWFSEWVRWIVLFIVFEFNGANFNCTVLKLKSEVSNCVYFTPCQI
jgi:hypothetical protein